MEVGGIECRPFGKQRVHIEILSLADVHVVYRYLNADPVLLGVRFERTLGLGIRFERTLGLGLRVRALVACTSGEAEDGGEGKRMGPVHVHLHGKFTP